MLSAHRHRVNLAESDECPYCKCKDKQTMEHALLLCPAAEKAVREARTIVRNLLKKRKASLRSLLIHEDPRSEKALLRLIHDLHQSGIQI